MGCSSSKNNKPQNSSLKIRKEGNEEVKIKKEKKDFEIKLVLLGDINVGKTSIALRYSKNIYKEEEKYLPTIGGAYTQKNIFLSDGISIKFHIWDTSGQERFRTMLNLYYNDAEAAILTYDITNEESLDSLNFWINELKNKVEIDKMILALAGNKCDEDDNNKRKVDERKGKKFASEHNMIFYETSAKNGTGIENLFLDIANQFYEMKKEK